MSGNSHPDIVRRVARPRGELTFVQEKSLTRMRRDYEAAEARWHATVVRTLNEGASFAEVSKFTGLSTNTLQRWKREVGS